MTTPNTPRDITIYSVTSENYTINLAGSNALLTMLNVGKSKIFLYLCSGGNSIASGFVYVPYDGSNLLTQEQLINLIITNTDL